MQYDDTFVVPLTVILYGWALLRLIIMLLPLNVLLLPRLGRASSFFGAPQAATTHKGDNAK
ncbi:hypothetical protein ACE6ED_10260 [Paenibacillus sp. CN-4]|uniref:hypothetical protein n=1 Tax=Paenibacillus nanchangensis TaxID=3348343 RepID=UPI00397CBF91